MAVAILINTLIGAGILTMPYSVMRSGGLAVGISMEMFVGIVAWGSLLMLGWLGTGKGVHSMQDIVALYCGRAGGTITALIITIAYFLICVSYVVAIRDQTASILADNLPLDLQDRWYGNARLVTFGIMWLLVAPFCFLPYIDQLKQISTFASVCVLYLAVLVMAGLFIPSLQNPAYANPAPLSAKIYTPAAHWSALFYGCASYALAYVSHPSSILVFDSLREKTYENYLKSITVSSAGTMIFYNLVIIFAVVTFGDRLQSHILLNYNSHNGVVLGASIFYMVKIMCEYVVLHFTARDGLMSLLRLCGVPSIDPESSGAD
jgi:amino acid permease